MKKLIAATIAALALVVPASAVATSGGAAYADAQNWARYVCPNACLGVEGSAIYDVNPGARSGQAQWNTYTNEYTNFVGRCEVIQVFAQFGPYSNSGYATPVYWTTYFVRWC